MHLFDAIFMLFCVQCTTAEGAQNLGSGRPKQAGDSVGTGKGSARRMGGWNAGLFEGVADWKSRMIREQGVSPSSVYGHRPHNTRRKPTNTYKNSWRRSWVSPITMDYLSVLILYARTQGRCTIIKSSKPASQIFN